MIVCVNLVMIVCKHPLVCGCMAGDTSSKGLAESPNRINLVLMC